MIQFNDGAQNARKISFNILQTLNVIVYKSMSFKRTRKLLEQGSCQGFYKMQITICQVLSQKKKETWKKTKLYTWKFQSKPP